MTAHPEEVLTPTELLEYYETHEVTPEVIQRNLRLLALVHEEIRTLSKESAAGLQELSERISRLEARR